MSNNTPYGRLVGVLKVYLAAAGTAESAIDAALGGSWTEVGATDGEQTLNHVGALTFFTDNDGTTPVKAVRPETSVDFTANLVNLTLEHVARVLHAVGNVATGTSGTADVKRMGLARTFEPTVYAVIARGSVMSPYGAFPAQYYLPRTVIDGEPSLVYSKSGSPMVEMKFTALRDSTQAAGMELGWLTAQID